MNATSQKDIYSPRPSPLSEGALTPRKGPTSVEEGSGGVSSRPAPRAKVCMGMCQSSDVKLEADPKLLVKLLPLSDLDKMLIRNRVIQLHLHMAARARRARRGYYSLMFMVSIQQVVLPALFALQQSKDIKEDPVLERQMYWATQAVTILGGICFAIMNLFHFDRFHTLFAKAREKIAHHMWAIFSRAFANSV